MKRSFLLFAFLLSAFIIRADVFANEKLVNFSWTSNENNIYLNLTIDKQLNFNDHYETKKIDKDLICQITCQPQNEMILDSDKLKEVVIIIVTSNEPNRSIDYLILIQNIYESGKEDYKKYSGTISLPAVNLDKLPKFIKYQDKLHQAFVEYEISYAPS